MRNIGNNIRSSAQGQVPAWGKALLIWLAAMLLALLPAACAPSAVTNSLVELDRSSSTSVSTSVSQAVSPASTSSALDGAAAFDVADIAAYEGKASAEVNGGVPFFTDADLARGAFEEYSPLDALGRCGTAFALVGPETMPTQERGSIGMVKPSGWQTVRYDGLVDGNYLYNRCHLIGYQLTGENDNELNLITGTRSMNAQGMLPYEDRVASYVERTGNHVLYRSTPVFEGADLVAHGVLLEAESVEDAGAGVRFCTWCYNVEPGVEIDYANGDSHLVEDAGTFNATEIEDVGVSEGADVAEPAGVAENAEVAEAATAVESAELAQPAPEANARTYILNTNTHKFHYPDCSSVSEMAEHNKQPFEGTRDEAIALGYVPCKRCNP